MTTTNPLNRVIMQAREWIADCTSEVPAGITGMAVMVLTHKNYEGGWPAFVSCDPDNDPELIKALIRTKFGAAFTRKMYPRSR